MLLSAMTIARTDAQLELSSQLATSLLRQQRGCRHSYAVCCKVCFGVLGMFTG